MKIRLTLILLNIFLSSIFGFGQKIEWSLFLKTNYPSMDIQAEEDLRYVFISGLSPNEIFEISNPFDITRSTKSKLGLKLGFQNQIQILSRWKILTGLTFKLIRLKSINHHPDTEWNWNEVIELNQFNGNIDLFDDSGKKFLQDNLYNNGISSERFQQIYYVDIPLGLQFTIIPNEWNIYSSIFYSRLFHAYFEGVESTVYKDRIIYKKNLIGWEVGTFFHLSSRMTFLLDFSNIPTNIYSNKNPFSTNSIPHPKGMGLNEVSFGLNYQLK